MPKALPRLAVAEYDYCPPEIACVNPLWFEVVAESGAAFPVDELVRAAFESSQEQVLTFGNEIPPGAAARIVLVFDVPAGGASRTLRSTDQASVPFSLPIPISAPVAVPEETVFEAEMNQFVPAGDIDLAATRAEVRTAIDLPSQPAPFVPQGEYIVVYLTLTNAGGVAAEYDICPPGGPLCLSQLWFQLSDAEYNAYPVEPIAWSAFSLKPGFLPFGSELRPGSPESVALVFDVPAGGAEWWLDSTADAPQQFSIRLQLSAAPGAIQVVRAAGGSEAGGAEPAIELILDTSGSMLESLEGQRRIDIAKDVLGQLVAETIPSGTSLALRVFGDTPDSCETLLAVPLQPLDPGAMSGTIASLESIDGVKTPIGASLERVAEDLQGATGARIVVLVTDGEETCGGDPAAAIRALAGQSIDLRVNIVGFAVADEALKAQFREWAFLGNGQYFDAAGSADLGQAIAAAVQPPFRILDAAGTEVASGLVNGEPIEVPAGAYTLQVLSAETFTIANVVVDSGARVEMPWDDR
ncbi:MAG: VWA domain-containing protein [Chloroflexia bacterium]|nr:VWA domain-containing protein [Chloroflexia bacterium]